MTHLSYTQKNLRAARAVFGIVKGHVLPSLQTHMHAPHRVSACTLGTMDGHSLNKYASENFFGALRALEPKLAV